MQAQGNVVNGNRASIVTFSLRVISPPSAPTPLSWLRLLFTILGEMFRILFPQLIMTVIDPNVTP